MVTGPTLGRYTHNHLAPEMHTVRLLRLPVTLFLRAREHQDDLVRELTLMKIRQTENDDAPPLPSGLAALVGMFGRRYRGNLQSDVEREKVLAGDGPTVDLTYEVPRSIVDELTALDKLLDDADEFCRNEQLLTLPRDAAVVEFGHWYSSEFRRQFDGLPPTPWTGALS